jgi:hypothetical protein
MENEMDLANFIIKMVVIIKENGEIIKWMDKEDFIIKEEKWPIKEAGKKINFMDMEKYIMIIQ